MPAGDMLAGDYQFQLGSTLYGRGSNGVYLDGGTPLSGLGVPDAKTQDVVLNHANGVFANPDYLQMRSISIPVIIKDTPSNAFSSFAALIAAWAPLTSDIDLAFQLPGWGKIYVLGRPRGLKDDFKVANRGVIRALLRFDCPDPTILPV